MRSILFPLLIVYYMWRGVGAEWSFVDDYFSKAKCRNEAEVRNAREVSDTRHPTGYIVFICLPWNLHPRDAL